MEFHDPPGCLQLSATHGQELFGLVAPGKGLLAPLQLLGDRQTSLESTGAGSPGVAVNAASGGKRTVPVGTGEPGIDGYLLHPAAIKGSQIGIEVRVA